MALKIMAIVVVSLCVSNTVRHFKEEHYIWGFLWTAASILNIMTLYRVFMGV